MTRTLGTVPRPDGFCMPAEWERHAQCWMVWPERSDNWRNHAIHAQTAYASVAHEVSKFEPVTMCVSSAQWENARSMLPPNVRVVEMSSNDAWMRDQGPLFVVDRTGLVRGVDWEFNAWGGVEDGCYKDWSQDALIAQKVLDLERLDRYAPGMILEGGSIETDGQGTLITTEECLLNPNRNPHLSQDEIEQLLRDYLGIDLVLWLPRGLYGDADTNGHVDNLCRFSAPGKVLLAWTDDPSDPQRETSCEAEEILSHAVDARGRRLHVTRVRQPTPMCFTKDEVAGIEPSSVATKREPGERLPASYVNFYIADGAVIVPSFEEVDESRSLQVIADAFPNNRIVQVSSRQILLGGGNIHCITLQQPLPVTKSSHPQVPK